MCLAHGELKEPAGSSSECPFSVPSLLPPVFCWKVTKVQACEESGLWCTPVMPALGVLRQENSEFETSLGYIEGPISKY